MPPKRKRVGDGAESAQNKKQFLSSKTSDTSPLLLPELISIVLHQLRWKDLLPARLVCSKWFNVWKSDKNIIYKIKYMKEYGGYSARTYKDITEGNELEGLDIPEYSRLSWKEKYELCVLQAAKMSAALRNTESDQILTVWALENGHFAFLKKIIAEDRYSNLEYFEGPTIIDMIMALPDYKSLKVIMTDLPQDLRDEIDLFTILLGATSTGNIRTAKKMFKYGFKSNKEVSRSCTTNAVFGKDYKMMKVLSDNLALYYDEDLVNMCDEFGWTDLNWQRE